MNSFNAKKIGFWIGIAIFVCIYFMPVPDGLSNEGKLTAAIFLLMGIWWATEAMPLYATALLPLIFFPLLGICLLYTSPSPRDRTRSRMPSSA